MTETREKFKKSIQKIKTDLDWQTLYDSKTMEYLAQAADMEKHMGVKPYSFQAMVWTLRDLYKQQGMAHDMAQKVVNPEYVRDVAYSKNKCCITSYILYHLYPQFFQVQLIERPDFDFDHYSLKFLPTMQDYDITGDQTDKKIPYEKSKPNTELVTGPYTAAFNVADKIGINLRNMIDRD